MMKRLTRLPGQGCGLPKKQSTAGTKRTHDHFGDQVMIRRLQYVYHGFGKIFRLHFLLATGRKSGGAEEIGFDGAWVDTRHLDAIVAQFQHEGFAEAA